MSCGPCASGGGCGGADVDSRRDPSLDGRGNPRAVLVDLSAGDTYGSASVYEIVQAYQGPVYLELWSYDADTAWNVERVRVGREGQRVTTEQRVNTGPVSRRVVFVSEGERATVRAYSRAVSAGQGWNDTTGRYSASTPDPYLLVTTYDDPPMEYGAAAAAAVSVASGSSETIVAAHHARFLTVYADHSNGTIEVLDRAGNVVSTSALASQNVLNCADCWPRVRVTNTGGSVLNLYWIATVQPPGMF